MPRLKAGTVQRSEVVNVRMKPKLRFGLELIARANSAKTTEAVEIAIQQALASIKVLTATGDGTTLKALEDIVELTWAKDEVGRFLNLALNCPLLLLEKELDLLNRILAAPMLRTEDNTTIDLMGTRISEALLREHWEDFI